MEFAHLGKGCSNNAGIVVKYCTLFTYLCSHLSSSLAATRVCTSACSSAYTFYLISTDGNLHLNIVCTVTSIESLNLLWNVNVDIIFKIM
jgi:hypothetical protein